MLAYGGNSDIKVSHTLKGTDYTSPSCHASFGNLKKKNLKFCFYWNKSVTNWINDPVNEQTNNKKKKIMNYQSRTCTNELTNEWMIKEVKKRMNEQIN